MHVYVLVLGLFVFFFLPNGDNKEAKMKFSSRYAECGKGKKGSVDFVTVILRLRSRKKVTDKLQNGSISV